ncbi:NAD(P)-dependent dehydrogenase (short-subunit alcohol dehydrogenase family) [Paenibacillus taihuensis]|uniref:NAD(P)-dependent dehydrogenase (Short-subunit alcohol dehydrogenase family) n=1 Tax=Paenibacillus taihuensis TaxID=1156355 RepID=A0A3D9QVX8_9BACL|nr:SDR family NAD(P)-dependent oxidoreductase [Paenibacillus taihuensis]REE67614.1 NAD(P)-dependent dehydrogenase (short-subunit alcohol dehydrogenase family) [Paenibacillus taihuensis]
MKFQGKVVVITGGSSGMGKAAAIEFAKQGANVVINGRREEALQHALQEIDPSGQHSDFVAGDISDPQIAERLIQKAITRFGRIDTLLNNAGIFIAKPFAEITSEEYGSALSTNVNGFFHVTQQAVRAMLGAGAGHIVTITASGVAEQPLKSVPSVLAALTKGALNTATKSLAIELSGTGIRVNAVAPGIIKTPMHPEETHEFLAKLHPIGRMGSVNDIVDAVLYLDSAPFVTGEILHVDGGQNAGQW